MLCKDCEEKCEKCDAKTYSYEDIIGVIPEGRGAVAHLPVDSKTPGAFVKTPTPGASAFVERPVLGWAVTGQGEVHAILLAEDGAYINDISYTGDENVLVKTFWWPQDGRG